MTLAIRDNLRPLVDGQAPCSNAGLLLTRFLKEQKGEEKNSEQAKPDLLRHAIECSSAGLVVYERAYRRWLDRLHSLSAAEIETVGSLSRLIVGLGNASVLETGLRLHHTYGAPLLPGSALKGLAAHYCDVVWGNRQPGEASSTASDQLAFRQRRDEEGDDVGLYHRLLFGTTEDEGRVTFHDAWILPESLRQASLFRDVMTPHHSAYYSGRGDAAPTDFDDPVPVPFLSVSGRFLLALSIDDDSDKGREWLDLAMKLLCQALENWGIGGKTSSGYGRMSSNPEQIAAAVPSEPKYGRGDGPIVVKCVKDERDRIKFEADDGFRGHIPGDHPTPDVGDTLEVWVALRRSVPGSTEAYTFSLKPPKKKRGGGKKPSRRR